LVIGLTIPSFLIASVLRRSPLVPVLTWVYCLAVLFTNEWYHDLYKFGTLSSDLAFLDGYRGTMRWHVSFNMIILRMISFNMDFYWAQMGKRHGEKDREKTKDGLDLPSNVKVRPSAPPFCFRDNLQQLPFFSLSFGCRRRALRLTTKPS